MTHHTLRRRVGLLFTALALAGCSSIPAGGDPARDPALLAAASAGGPALGRVAIAPIATLCLAATEVGKGWRPSELAGVEPSALGADLERALTALGRFERVRRTSGEPLADAWTRRDDLVVTTAIRDLRSHDDGRNAWWIPNIVNWFFWMAPAWWVATEEYSLTAELEVVVSSAESGRVIAVRTAPLRVAGTFDEFDRGWQLFGFLYTSLDAEVWRTIAAKLMPALKQQAAVSGAIECARAIEAATLTGDVERARTKTLVLAVGVSRFADGRLPVPHSADDARAVASATRALVDRDQHVMVLVDAGATLAAVRSAVTVHLARARPGDQVLVYFNGAGTRRADDAPALLLHDAAQGTAAGLLGLDDLAGLLAPIEGNKLVVVDAEFGERGDAGELAALTRPGLAFVAAGGPDDPALAAGHLGGRVFTYYLVHALRSTAAGETGADLFASVRPQVIAEAALLGARQTPRAAGELDAFVLVRRESR